MQTRNYLSSALKDLYIDHTIMKQWGSMISVRARCEIIDDYCSSTGHSVTLAAACPRQTEGVYPECNVICIYVPGTEV